MGLRRTAIIATWVIALGFVQTTRAVQAREITVRLDPARTTIGFTLGAVMHTVDGTFKLKDGEIRFDPTSGRAAGAIVVDATTGNTDNGSRDKKMHQQVLESRQFPEIVFSPERVQGSLTDRGISQMKVAGTIRLHGHAHEMTLVLSVERSGQDLKVTTHFAVPFVSWGLKDPSTFLLRVDKIVNVEVQAAGSIQTTAR